MTIHLRSDFGVLTAPLATLVQPTLFNGITTQGAGVNIAYQTTGGPLEALVRDPMMKLTWTGAPPTSVAAYTRKWINYGGVYDDASWGSARPSQYRFRVNVNQNLAGFTVGDELQLLRFFHNSGATALDYAAVWLRRTATGYAYRLREQLWSGATCLPPWDYQGSTFGMGTFPGYTEFMVDIVNVPGASFIQVGQPSPDTRALFFGATTTGINGEGYSQLFLGGATMPRIAGFDIGCVTASVAAPFTGGGEIRFDNVKMEDNLGPGWSEDQSAAILGTSANPPMAGHANEIDCGHVRLFGSQAAFFGSPMSALYTLSHGQAAFALATKVPAANIAVEPNAMYALSVAVIDQSVTMIGDTTLTVREFINDAFFPDSPEHRDMLAPASRSTDYIFRTGPRQNCFQIACGQVPAVGTDYYLRRLR